MHTIRFVSGKGYIKLHSSSVPSYSFESAASHYSTPEGNHYLYKYTPNEHETSNVACTLYVTRRLRLTTIETISDVKTVNVFFIECRLANEVDLRSVSVDLTD